MVICKAHEILWNEAGLLSAAVTKYECNAADGRFGTACYNTCTGSTSTSNCTLVEGRNFFRLDRISRVKARTVFDVFPFRKQ